MSNHGDNARQSGAAKLREVSRISLPATLVLVAAAVIRSFSVLRDDISWLITIAEKTLAGGRAYLDFIEVNPPGSLIVYMVPVLAAHVLGIKPETAVSILTFVGALASIGLAGRILLQAELLDRSKVPTIAALALGWLLVAPGNAFAQREHIGLIAMLPMLAIQGVRADGKSPKTADAALAGLGGGIAIAIKPYFLLPILFSFMMILFRTRPSLRQASRLVATPEILSGSVILIAYALACVVLFSSYFSTTLPLVLELYVRFRWPVVRIIFSYPSLFIGAALLLCQLVGRSEFPTHPATIFTVAAMGFAVGVFVQGKGFPYQSAPALLLLMFVAGWLLIERRWFVATAKTAQSLFSDSKLVICGTFYVALGTAVLIYLGFSFHQPRLFFAVARLAPPHPRIAAITESLKGPQLARFLGGTWIERTPSSWIGQYAAGWGEDSGFRLPALNKDERARIAEYGRMDRDMFVDAIRFGKPDVIFVDPDSFSQARLLDPFVARAMIPYRCVEAVSGVTIWMRRPEPSRRAVAGDRLCSIGSSSNR